MWFPLPSASFPQNLNKLKKSCLTAVSVWNGLSRIKIKWRFQVARFFFLQLLDFAEIRRSKVCPWEKLELRQNPNPGYLPQPKSSWGSEEGRQNPQAAGLQFGIESGIVPVDTVLARLPHVIEIINYRSFAGFSWRDAQLIERIEKWLWGFRVGSEGQVRIARLLQQANGSRPPTKPAQENRETLPAAGGSYLGT